MAGSSPHTSTADVVDGTLPVAVGLGIITLALFPLAIPALALTAVALIPLLIPLLLITLVWGLIVVPIVLLRRLLRRAALSVPPRRSEPGGQRVGEPQLGSVAHPGHISVGPNQHGGGSSDRPECRKLPRTHVFGVDRLNPIRPGSDVEAAGLTEVEQHRPGIVQQGEDPQRAVRR